MAKIISFSKKFPAYHPKAGQPTYFVEKFWKSLWDQKKSHNIHLFQEPHDNHFHPMGANDMRNVHEFKGKHHTIRAGSRWKQGEYFSPRVWSGKPYNSKMIKIADDTLIERIFDFQIDPLTSKLLIEGKEIEKSDIFELAVNDGLFGPDLLAWFKWPKQFSGQVICWNPEIKY